ncbi:MAG: response regulator [Actinomycetota bacterium]|nr:response regulator [Actinomycetota bacterium]
MTTRDLRADPPTSGLHVLLAEDNDRVRSLFAGLLREAAAVASVIEAKDGGEAVELGRAQSPDVAVLDLRMPRLDGAEAALRLRALRPSMKIALHSSDPEALRQRASGLGLPLFHKLEFERLVEWVERQAAESAPAPDATARGAAFAEKTERVCSVCGYGIVACTQPERCPMCGRSGAWTDPPVHTSRTAAHDRIG